MRSQQTGNPQNARSLNPRVMEALAKSEEYKMEGKHLKALSIAESVLMQDPECKEAAEEVADNLLSLDRLKEAKKAAQYVLKLDPESYIGNFVIGFAASSREEWTKAINAFRRSNAGQPNNPEILRCLGWALFHAGKTDDGIATLRRALFLRENDAAILCDLAACLLQQNEFAEAAGLLRKAVALEPQDERVKELFEVANRLEQAFQEDLT